ncbi:MAG: ABC transporter ATP-binding protein [Scytolyngbya sp. HA4215-MV1]|jgi:lipopolysaccharide transport system ATP-binding protein|nr:ABC transporter ATP-binding protein [Scytolyngbya sp. HA4215-MV1]
MTNSIIQVENLGKKYILKHQSQERYTSLRDVISDRVQSIGHRFMGSRSRTLIPNQEEFWALKDVSFKIQQGDRVGIIGRNGAGKSTLLKILSRITEPTHGRIRIKGRVASLLEVGTGFHPELTGRENIFLNGAILGMGKAEISRKFDEIVAFAEIEKFLDTPVKRYSSGMYVRLAFAVAAHLEPEILIVDEVLAVGDLQFQKKCLGKMEDVGKEGRTVLFVSHNLATVKQLCTRAILLANGGILADGNPIQIASKYMQSFTTNSLSDAKKTYHHIKGDRRAEISNITINNISQNEAVVSIFDQIEIAINYQLNQPIQEIEFFVLVSSFDDGEVQASLFQRDSNTRVKPTSNQGQLKISFMNHFLPGRYTISAGIFDEHKKFVDWVEYVESFQVESAFKNGQKYDHRLGKISLQGNWHVE